MFMGRGKQVRVNGKVNEKAARNPRIGKGGNPCEPLSTCRTGDDVRIVEIEGDAALKRRLRHLGLRPGKPLRVRQKSPAGMVVSSHGLKLALGKDAAEQILVETDIKKA